MGEDERLRICLWFDQEAEQAATFYTGLFPDSQIKGVYRAPADYPSGKAGDVLTVDFTLLGTHVVGLNGGPIFPQSEAFSFQVPTDSQEETDHYWNSIIDNGGSASACGWCKDRWGVAWQITPRVLTDAMASADAGVRERAFAAMMTMQKIDVATIEAAVAGTTST